MGEVGCLKDGNFQNLETQDLLLDGNRLNTTKYVSIGDNTAADIPILATGLTKNAVHIINGNGGNHGTTITLPSKAEIATFGLVIGDFYTFVVGSESTRAIGHTIRTDDKVPDGGLGNADGTGAFLIGGVRLIRSAGGVANATSGNDQPTELTSIYPQYGTDELVLLKADDATGGGGGGSHVTFRYMGQFGPGSGDTVHWKLSGEILSASAASTGATTFAALP